MPGPKSNTNGAGSGFLSIQSCSHSEAQPLPWFEVHPNQTAFSPILGNSPSYQKSKSHRKGKCTKQAWQHDITEFIRLLTKWQTAMEEEINQRTACSEGCIWVCCQEAQPVLATGNFLISMEYGWEQQLSFLFFQTKVRSYQDNNGSVSFTSETATTWSHLKSQIFLEHTWKRWNSRKTPGIQ